MKTEDATRIFEALTSEDRLNIFRLLVKHAPDGLIAGEISQLAGIPKTNLSFHLKAIVHSGLASMIATKMRKLLNEREWEITLIDRDPVHHYQPGWLLIPFGVDTPQGCVRPKKDFISRGVNFVLDTIIAVDPVQRKVECKNSTHTYDWIVVASGARIAPDEVPGLLDDWGGKIHNFYTHGWSGGLGWVKDSV